MKIKFICFALITLVIQVEAQNAGTRSRRPNIIIINMDDMGYGDTEPYGMSGISTPNFNKAAKEGMRFTHFNVAQAVCSPSRAALLTGCYPNRIGMSGGALMPWSTKALNASEETIAEILKKAGYITGMLGKWHLGSRPPHLPLHHGFESYYGTPYSNDMWPVDYDGKPITDTANRRKRYPPLPVLEGDKQVKTITTLEQQAQLTTTLTEKAVQYITKNKNQPFFLYLAHPMPHVPLAASSKFSGKSRIGLFGDVVMELDWSLGEIMNALDKNKISSHTLLIITSDNGPWRNFGEHAGSTGGLREGKGTAWDGGTRVPCIIRWPGKVQAGAVSSQLLTNMDLLPTIRSIAGALPPKYKIDGIDFSELLLGKSTRAVRDVFYYYYDVNNLKAVRYKNWKLVLPHKSQSYALNVPGMNGYPGKVASVDIKMALYNLSNDPGENYDAQESYPDVVKTLMDLVEQARDDLGDDLTNRKGKNVREATIVMDIKN